MKRTDLPERFQFLLQHMPYVTVASVCPDGSAWNTPLVGYFDDQLNLYWASDTESQHSKNITQNGSIFVIVYDTGLPLGDGVGLYLEMQARVLKRTTEVETAKQVYLDRYGEDDPDHTAFMDSCPRRIYRAKPLRVWWNTDGKRSGHFVDRRELLLSKAH